MNTVTHAILPLIIADFKKKGTHDEKPIYWNKTRLFFLALAGALPDILSPHMSIYARYRSYSHTVNGLLAASLAFLLIYGLGRKDWRLASMSIMAYSLHLLIDLLAGGIVWNYPFSNAIIGDYYIPVILWLPIDFICILYLYFHYRALPAIRRARHKKAKIST